MSEHPPFSRPQRVSDVTASGRHARLEASADELSGLASFLRLSAVAALWAELDLAPFGRAGLSVAGTVTADLTQISVVSGETFECRVEGPVEIRFSPDGRDPNAAFSLDELLDPDAEDPPDLLTGDTVDLGSVATEFLALALDPYPRKPGESFEPPPEEPDSSPFGALSGLGSRTDL